MIRKALSFGCLFLLLQSCHVGRFFIYNFADVRDYKKFPAKEIKRSPQPFYFKTASDDRSVKLPMHVKRNRKNLSFEKGLQKSGSYAFIMIRNDTIIYEWYRPGFTPEKIHPSFSIAKSFVSALIGVAIKDGKIKSTSEPIVNYIPEMDKEKFGKITIQHLLDMQSGIKFSENYFNPFGDIAKYYYGTNLKKYLRHLQIEETPGRRFRYISLNSQLLALVLENATGKSVSAYVEEQLWQPLGMEYDASWNIDSKKNNTEKAFCCINGRAKDFAKLGRLYLKKGDWNGTQLLSKAWVDESVNFTTPRNNYLYSNNFWHTRRISNLKDTTDIKDPFYIYYPQKEGEAPPAYAPSGDYFAQGFLGQYVYVSPKNNLIIVRLAKKEGGIVWPLMFRRLAAMN